MKVAADEFWARHVQQLLRGVSSSLLLVSLVVVIHGSAFVAGLNCTSSPLPLGLQFNGTCESGAASCAIECAANETVPVIGASLVATCNQALGTWSTSPNTSLCVAPVVQVQLVGPTVVILTTPTIVGTALPLDLSVLVSGSGVPAGTLLAGATVWPAVGSVAFDSDALNCSGLLPVTCSRTNLTLNTFGAYIQRVELSVAFSLSSTIARSVVVSPLIVIPGLYAGASLPEFFLGTFTIRGVQAPRVFPGNVPSNNHLMTTTVLGLACGGLQAVPPTFAYNLFSGAAEFTFVHSPALDFERVPSCDLTVRVADPSFSIDYNLTVLVADLPENPRLVPALVSSINASVSPVFALPLILRDEDAGPTRTPPAGAIYRVKFDSICVQITSASPSCLESGSSPVLPVWLGQQQQSALSLVPLLTGINYTLPVDSLFVNATALRGNVTLAITITVTDPAASPNAPVFITQAPVVVVVFRDCSPGTGIQSARDAVVGLVGLCESCPPGTYSAHTTDKVDSCFACPVNASCAGGRAPFVALPGFWLEPTGEIVPCTFTSLCPGANECPVGHTGRMCLLCQPDFFTTAKPLVAPMCRPCPKTPLAAIIGIACGLLVISAAVVYFSKRMATYGALLSVTVNFLQIVVLVVQTDGMPTRAYMRQLIGLLSFVNLGTSLIHPECSLGGSASGYELLLYFRLSLMPLLIAAYAVLVLATARCTSARRSLVRDRGLNVLLLLLGFLYVTTVDTALLAFDCRRGALRGAPTVRCSLASDPLYRRTTAVSIVMLLAFGMGYPCCVAALVWSAAARRELRTPETLRRLGSLVVKYRVMCAPWDLTTTARKITVLLLLRLVGSIQIRFGAIGIAQLVFWCLHTAFQPFAIENANVLESVAFLCTTAVLVLGLVATSVTPSLMLVDVTSALLLIAVLALVGVFLWQVVVHAMYLRACTKRNLVVSDSIATISVSPWLLAESSLALASIVRRKDSVRLTWTGVLDAPAPLSVLEDPSSLCRLIENVDSGMESGFMLDMHFDGRASVQTQVLSPRASGQGRKQRFIAALLRCFCSKSLGGDRLQQALFRVEVYAPVPGTDDDGVALVPL